MEYQKQFSKIILSNTLLDEDTSNIISGYFINPMKNIRIITEKDRFEIFLKLFSNNRVSLIWGDGSTNNIEVNGEKWVSHIYDKKGDYTLHICGNISDYRLYFD